MAYSGKISISSTEQKSFVTAYSHFLRFVAGDPSMPGRDWEFVICEDDSGRANNFNFISYSGTLNVTQLNTWIDLPTVHSFNLTLTRGGQTLQQGVDYEHDFRLGRVRFLTGSPPFSVSYSYQFRRCRVVLKNMGLNGQSPVFVGFLMVSAGFDRANIITRVYKNYVPLGTPFFDTTAGNSTPRVSDFDCAWGLWNGSIDMWIFSNKQRIIIVARNNTMYTSAYIGRFFPFSLPSEYPYPLINVADLWIKQDLSAGVWHDSQNSNRRYIARALFDGYGRAVCGSDGTFKYANTFILPFANDNEESNYTPIAYLPSWDYVLFPSYILQENVCLGQLDGVYWAPGLNLSSESIVTINNKQYIIFQDCHRTGWQDYMAILCE